METGTGSSVDIASVMTWLQTYKVFIEWAGVIILALTGVVVWAYTRATKQMVKEMVVQRKISLRPIVVIHREGSGRQYSAVNLGHGIAVSVYLKTIRFEQEPPHHVHGVYFNFETIHHLPALSGKANLILYEVIKGRSKLDPVRRWEEYGQYMEKLFPETEERDDGPPLKAVLCYEDIEGRKYFTVCRLLDKGPHIVEVGEGEPS